LGVWARAWWNWQTRQI